MVQTTCIYSPSHRRDHSHSSFIVEINTVAGKFEFSGQRIDKILEYNFNMNFRKLISDSESSPTKNKKSKKSKLSNGVGEVASNLTKLDLATHEFFPPKRYDVKDGEISVQACLNQFTDLELMNGKNQVACKACTEKENKVFRKVLINITQCINYSAKLYDQSFEYKYDINFSG